MQRLDIYLEDILGKQLLELGVNKDFVAEVTENIRTQMLSALIHWEDRKFWKAMVQPVVELSSFYTPEADLDVKSFVALTVRNSKFEVLQSCDCESAGLTDSLEDGDVKQVTQQAIHYFKGMDFTDLNGAVKEAEVVNDYYGRLAKKYPMAWNALWHLANKPGQQISYKPIVRPFPFTLTELNPVRQGAEMKQSGMVTVFDGYSENFDQRLVQALRDVDSGNLDIYLIDSFKSLSRNYEKMLKVMEFVLSRNKIFITSNYYIENGYLEKRKKLLKAGHSNEEIQRNILNPSGLKNKHLAFVKFYKQGL